VIDFEKPLRKAWQRTKDQLFVPFDAKHWLILGFTAWLAISCEAFSLTMNLMSVINTPSGWLELFSNLSPADSLTGLSGTLSVICLIWLTLSWLGAHGQFMFLDNVVHRRALVVEPWKSFRFQANNLFVFSAFLTSVVWLLLIVPIGIGVFAYFTNTLRDWEVWVAILLVSFALVVPSSILCFFFAEFGRPIMYLTGCRAAEAFRLVWRLVLENPLDSFLYLLVRIGLSVAFLFLASLTCCIGALPYLSTVVTLPLSVFRTSFILDCLSQFDPAYDLWGKEATPPPLLP